MSRAEIKLRLDDGDKAKIKELADQKGVSINKLVLDIVLPAVEDKLLDIKYKDIINDRAVATDKKLSQLKEKLGTAKQHKKFAWLNRGR